MTRPTTEPRPVLRDGAVYWADGGRRLCARCAGSSALYTGHDISGQRVERITTDEAREWEREFARPLDCEMGCTTLSTVAGADGWPMAKGGAS